MLRASLCGRGRTTTLAGETHRYNVKGRGKREEGREKRRLKKCIQCT
jgi:hypothetical protein